MYLDRRALLGGLAAAALAPAVAQAQDWTPPAPDRELRVPVRGGRIYARVNGDLAGPHAPVVFVHGGPGSNHGGFLAELALADRRAVILYDQLDSGLSDRPNDPANWTVERFVSEVDALRAALDLRRFHLVGHSWGSTLALEYAARQPGGLLSVTLGSPLISTRSWEASTTAQLRRLPRETQRIINVHEAAGTTDDPAYAAAMSQFYARYATRGPVPPYFAAYRKATGLRRNDAIYQGMWGSGEIRGTGTLRGYDGEPLLSRITAPTLFLCGEEDEMTADVLRPLVRRVRGARLAVIPDAGHSLPATHAQAYMAALRPHFYAADPKPALG
ncbi:MAG: proline iminopeptidase-family hydrolase [Alphaproteobacteria bacterium]|nr:proline iminopeptidase-family hydrolase [Alphaproteobacteria bacterium]MBU1515066.1 proline iminopeptidase-family hydrolase [Alphaproteobacteria bacterium]MBU2094991.1 proline iminopeptidase-family hydrolase [Alphaproteobacteria bacterium]MBU2149761.1 proline iminopeptidase-family hydrolase [Alphaproteobacteria bacterium]MBU2307639.1 proline iminopeptidase-family hydrolase [Alphaproteobacteria bacterium]